jgi:calcineurin-like phosphoesterase family protein
MRDYNIWFTSDCHFSHANILKFCEKTRKYTDVEEMNTKIIAKWNSMVKPNDEVYILGDLFFCKESIAIEILEQLAGKKHLILGNHDKGIRNSEKLQQYFESISEYKEIKIDGKPIILFHYPIVEFNKMHYSAWHLHGHTHNSFAHNGKALDVGMDGPLSIDNGLVSFESVREYMSTRPVLAHHSSIIVEKARLFATAAHSAIGQKRKYTGEPYIVHPTEVATMVKQYTNDDNMIAAAWLHDVLEDTNVSEQELRAEFGDYITNLVLWLTDVSKPEDGNRAARKAIDLVHTAMASTDAKTIKLADIISNVSSIREHDPEFAVVYLKEKKAQLEVLKDGNQELYVLAKTIVDID